METWTGANIGPNSLNFSAEWEHGPFWVRGTMRRYFPRHFRGQDARNDFLGYSLLGAETGYKLGRAQVSIAVSNLATTLATPGGRRMTSAFSRGADGP